MKNQMIAGIILTITIIVFIAVYWAYEPERQAAAQREQFTKTMERGARGYVTAGCAVCHGVNGGGLDAPSLNDTQLPEDTRTKIIERGVANTEMPPWSVEEGGSLREQEIRDITTFITNWDDDLLYSIWDELGPELATIPLSAELQTALSEAREAIKKEEIFWAKLQLDEALSAAELMIQKAWIEKIIETVTDGNLSEATEQLEALVGSGDGHGH